MASTILRSAIASEATRRLNRSAYEAERIRGNQDDLAARPAMISRTAVVEPMSDSGHKTDAATAIFNVRY
jgi:hypothetical protein